MVYSLGCHPCSCYIDYLFTGHTSSLCVRIWALEPARPVGLISVITIVQQNSFGRSPTEPRKGVKVLMCGGGRLLVQISIVYMRSILESLLETRWFVGVKVNITTFFVDNGW